MKASDPAGWRERLLRALQLRALVSPRVQQVLLVASAVFLVVGLVLSINAYPQSITNLSWPPLLIAIAVNVPLGLALAVVEFVVSARLIQKRISVRYALITVIYGSAANMLPLPGALMARLLSLKGVGARYRDGAYATLVSNLVWFSLSFLWAGMWLTSIETGLVSVLFLTVGTLLGGMSLLTAKWLGAGILDMLLLCVTRSALIGNQSVRLLLCLMAIQANAEFAQSAVLSLSAIIGSAVSLVPAGFGLREGAAAALSPVVGLAAAAGFLAALVNRILGLMVLAPLAALLAWRSPPVERMAGNRDDTLSTK